MISTMIDKSIFVENDVQPVDLEVPQFQTNPYAFEVGDLHFRFLKYTLAMDTWMHSANPK